MKPDIKGIMPALATPLTEEERLDEKTWRNLIRKTMAAGCQGIVVLGSCGEGMALRERERQRVTEIALEEMDGKGPVVVGAGAANLEVTERYYQEATRLGADAVLVAPPCYYPLPLPALTSFFRGLAQSGGAPIILYNIPPFTKVLIPPAVVAELAQEEAIIGLKDSAGDFSYFQTLVNNLAGDGFKVFQGKSSLVLPSILIKGAGSITATGNITPQWEVELYRLAAAGDLEGAREYQKKLNAVGTLLAYRSLPITVTLKEIMSLMGLLQPYGAAPWTQLDASGRGELRTKLAGLEIPLAG